MDATGGVNDYIAGCLGGIAGLVVGHPFDTTKVQMQTQLAGHHYKGTWDAIKNIYHHGLGRGFFRGLSFPLVSYGAINSVFFGVYGNSLRWLHPDTTTQPSYRDIYIAGCIGGTAQLAIACPVDVVKVVLQSQIPHGNGSHQYFKGPIECMRALYKHGGIQSLYRGNCIMFMRDIPAQVLYMGTFEGMQDVLHAYDIIARGAVLSHLLSGGMAGVISWLAIMPADIVKSRLQADHSAHTKIYSGTLNCISKMYVEGGLRIFYTGSLVTAIRAFPVNAIILAVYSQSLIYMKGKEK
ncbi:solute carrier family 25 member 45 isoform X2 [Lingula anatina]|uniref:Solute carrier family 25 member 45 isoform X2 n=1 Tax=Lingula anatina TaxID=7574 RepID=A0A1S3HFH1_LINAN|nr:solute carrier family 25 member 45 isoform X2 [Lingula anatina]|eukprot:XP_013384827.1 solute carrier family 25 member 45 isoform X2 [Lingula anatina]